MSYTNEGTGLHSQNRQKPAALPKSAFGSANLPIVTIMQDKNASEVVINGQTSGSYFLATKVTGSVPSAVGPSDMVEVYNTAGAGADAAPVRLRVNACAWSGSGGPTTGDVTFEYHGGL